MELNVHGSAENRRDFLKQSTMGLGGVIMSGFAQSSERGDEKKTVVCVGGHPDDPESGCGGTLALLAANGFEVTIIYLTTGEAGIEGKTHAEAAAIRKQEAFNACKVLKAKPVFAGQIDGSTIMNAEWIGKMSQLIEQENPVMLFTHWPIDSHRDHQVASLLAIQAWQRAQQRYPLYFFEVLYGIQTTGFNPTDFIDITSTQEQKRNAVYCHASQNPAGIYDEGHAEMESYRGKAINKKAAEAFVRLQGNTGSLMLEKK